MPPPAWILLAPAEAGKEDIDDGEDEIEEADGKGDKDPDGSVPADDNPDAEGTVIV